MINSELAARLARQAESGAEVDTKAIFLVGFAATLWDGQTSRHGKQTGTVPETLEAARAGVHLAAALVQWFVSGAVVRTP